MPTAKKKLEINHELNFSIIGLYSKYSDLLVCSTINSTLKIKLKLTEPHVINVNKKNQSFPKFMHIDEISNFEYCLIKNKNDSKTLLSEYKKFDFFLLINEILEEQKLMQISKSLIQTNIFSIANQIEINTISNPDLLIVW